jgi:GNAT superfamily N-acetyltransferase
MGTTVRIRVADPTDEGRLREIATAAKGYWGYEPEVVHAWAEAADFSTGGVHAREVFVAEAAGHAVAWAALVPRGRVVWLDDMWVEPAWIGKGVGSALFRYCAERATALGGRTMEWEADPNAVGFYEKVGGHYLRDSEPSEWGRVLPVMGIELAND